MRGILELLALGLLAGGTGGAGYFGGVALGSSLTPSPSWDRLLSRREMDDLVAFLYSLYPEDEALDW